MNQKFINVGQRSQKKQSSYQSQKSKRFTRKRSSQSDRSIDSRNSKYSSRDQSTIIKDFTLTQPSSGSKQNKIHLNMDDFSQHLMTSVLLSKQLTPSKARYNRIRNNQRNNNYQKQQYNNGDMYALMAELEVRNKEIQVMGSECQCIKLTLEQEVKKNKKCEEEKSQLTLQLGQKNKQIQKYQIENKKLIQQKKILMKQIQFLQKINYDEKTRNVQSYREKYLQKQIQQLRKKIQLSKSDLQRQLQDQIQKISNQKYNIENLNKALKVANQTLMKNLQKIKLQQRSSIFHSQQYKKLRQKYKMCLDAYKNLKIQYCQLQKQLNRSLNNIPQHILNSNSQLSIVLSSSSSQRSVNKKDKNMGNNGNANGICINNKENKSKFYQKKQDILLDAIQTVDITPVKKSLSPRNREEAVSFSSPKNTTKSSLNLLNQKKSTPTSYRYKCQSQLNSRNKNIVNNNFFNQKV